MSKRRKLRYESDTPVHSPEICVFCQKPEDKLHPNRSGAKFFRVEQWKSWNRLKASTPYIENTAVRERLLVLMNECNDPFARDIRYHKKCWLDNVKTFKVNANEDVHIQNIRMEEIIEIFHQHVEKCVITDKEPRLLSGLLNDYNRIRENFNMDNCLYTSTVRKIIEEHFGDRIGFHARTHKNQSMIVYDKSGGGTYIEAAINAWGIDDDVLVKNVASRLHEKVRHSHVSSPHCSAFLNVLICTYT